MASLSPKNYLCSTQAFLGATDTLCSRATVSAVTLRLLFVPLGPLPPAPHPVLSVLEDPSSHMLSEVSKPPLCCIEIPLHFVSVMECSPDNRCPVDRPHPSLTCPTAPCTYQSSKNLLNHILSVSPPVFWFVAIIFSSHCKDRTNLIHSWIHLCFLCCIYCSSTGVLIGHQSRDV